MDTKTLYFFTECVKEAALRPLAVRSGKEGKKIKPVLTTSALGKRRKGLKSLKKKSRYSTGVREYLGLKR